VSDIDLCFEGAVPAVIATAAADGTPNVTYLSRVHPVDDERVALSNQFFSKTARNLAENPRANLLLIDPTTYWQYRLELVYERTERRGPVFERLRDDVDALAALEGMQDVFRLRAADIYRVLHIEQVPSGTFRPGTDPLAVLGVRPAGMRPVGGVAAALAEMAGRMSRSGDLDTLVGAVVDGLADIFGYEHSLLMLADEEGRRLYTIASHGYDAEGVGSEVLVGEGMIGMAAARCTPVRVSSLRWMGKYSRSIRRSYEDAGDLGPGADIPVPGLPLAQSRVAVPAMARGSLVGVLVVESTDIAAFTAEDECQLAVVATMLAAGVEAERAQAAAEGPVAPSAATTAGPATAAATGDTVATQVRFFEVDGSTFLDGDYLIKGVAGRILWSLVRQYEADGRVDFTNREVRLDPSLDLPSFRDNFESRLILLKRRLDERQALIRIEKTGRGRFRLAVEAPLRLECAPS
jgi:GAF domain-containing protein/predicted pyridoxine 5'-phosphate oxidase superfamily flavin-nucleotide-binding protein